MLYTCLVIDDNPIERESLTRLLKKLPELSILASCSSALEAREMLRSQRPDIIFSDIDMPDLSGMELLKSLKQPPAFVFITSYPDYAAESYELDAVDYIVKPVKLPRLTKSVSKVIEYLATRQQLADRPVADTLPAAGKEDDFFYIKEARTYTRLRYSEVVCIESMGDFSKLFTTAGKTHIALVNLKNIEMQLPENSFGRIHKQFLVNLEHIRSITPDTVEMTDGQQLAYSPAYRQGLLDKTVNRRLITRYL
ncbi:MAG: LytTR family DNA-binding domain-containing protein [Chitinophagaceae bacterium]